MFKGRAKRHADKATYNLMREAMRFTVATLRMLADTDAERAALEDIIARRLVNL